MGEENRAQFLRSYRNLRQPHVCAAAGVELQLQGAASIALVSVAHEGSRTRQTVEDGRTALGAGQSHDQTGSGLCRRSDRGEHDQGQGADGLHLWDPVMAELRTTYASSASER